MSKNIKSVADLPEKCLLKILGQMKIMSRVRFRQTCRKIDEFYENHRFELKFTMSHLNLVIHLKESNFDIYYYTRDQPRRRILLLDAFNRLSAVPLAQISVCAGWNDESLPTLPTLLEFLKKTQLKCAILDVNDSFSQKDSFEIIANISALTLKLQSGKLPFEKLVSHEVVKNISGFFFYITKKQGLLPEDITLLDKLSHLLFTDIRFEYPEEELGFHFVHRIFKEINENPNLETLRLLIQGLRQFNLPQISKNLHCVWKNTSPRKARKPLKELYLQEFPSTFLLVLNEEFGDNLVVKHQRLTFLMEKKYGVNMKERLKEITKESPSDEEVEHLLRTVHEAFMARETRSAGSGAPVEFEEVMGTMTGE